MLNFHPSTQALSVWCDNSPIERRSSVTRHLAECAECRHTVQRMQELAASLLAISAADPHSLDTWDRVRTRVMQGDVVVLPAAEPSMRRSVSSKLGRRIVQVAAALAAMVGAGAIMMQPASLQATRGVLTASPSVVAGPGTVRLRYVPMPGLHAEPILRVRGRLRDARDEYRLLGTTVQELTLLHRQGDGTYTGTITFPTGAVVALLAVEDTTGSTIDSNSGRYWTVSMGTANDPAADARQQYAYDMMESNWPLALQSLRDLAASWPEDPWRWAIVLASENATPELLADVQRRFERFEADTNSTRLDNPQYVEGMELLSALLASESRDTALRSRASHWRHELISRHPGSAYAQDRQVINLLTEHRADRAALARALDDLFLRVPAPHHSRVLQAGLDVAVTNSAFAVSERWASRWLDERPFEAPLVAERLITARASGAALDRAMSLVTDELNADPDRRRDLRQSRQEHALAAAEYRVRMLSLAVRSALLKGDTARARSHAAAALAVPQTFESATILHRLLEQHQPLASTTSLAALLELDPVRQGANSPDSNRSLPTDGEARARRDAIVAALRTELPIASQGRMVQGADGSSRALSDLLAHPNLLVMSFHPWCPYSRTAMTELSKWRDRLKQAGVDLVILTAASPASIASYRADGGILPEQGLWFDPTGAALDVLHLVGTPMITSVSEGVQLTRPTSLTREAVRRALLLTGS